MITYAIFGKKEGEQYDELLQEKQRVQHEDGTITNEYIVNMYWANEIKKFYESKGFVCKILTIDMDSNLTQMFKDTVNI
jgi:hypothetical protein